MHKASVFLRLKFIVEAMCVGGQFWYRDARFQHFHIGHDMFMCMLHRINHICTRLLVTDPPRATDINANSVRANQVCIKSYDFIVLNKTWSTFLKPRVGTRP